MFHLPQGLRPRAPPPVLRPSGIAPAAAALAWTSRLSVGIALMPVPLRNVALTAMEIATLARLFPGRFLPAVGHGVLDWMGQTGARVESPMTLLREYVQALQSLLVGDRVTCSGRYVTLDDVALDWPPEQVPPLGDGVVVDVTEHLPQARAAVQEAWATAGKDGEAHVLVFQTVALGTPAEEVLEAVRARVAEGAHRVAITVVGSLGGPPEAGPALLEMIPTLG
ncbi:MAG: LLM class flavin-dependent oxidoreductase, partial [Arsenicicoccus sp.]